MKAWLIEAGADGPRLAWRAVDDLVPGENELLLAVRAVGLNRADLSRRAGHFGRIATRPPHPVAGLEAAGEVVATGAGVTGWAVGDRVMGMPSGAYAEQALIDHRLALRVPDAVSWAQAAALPVAMLTAHDALVTQGRMARGEAVFVQAASSAVGIAALQIARAMGAGVVAGTASAAKLDRLVQYGLTHGVDHAAGAAAPAVLAATGGQGADVIVDMVGARAIEDHLAMAALAARWVQIGRMGGSAAPIDLDLLSKKRVSLIGVTFRTRDVEEFAAVVRAAWRDLGAMVASGRFAMPVERVFALDAADAAQEAMRDNRHLGKFILEA